MPMLMDIPGLPAVPVGDVIQGPWGKVFDPNLVHQIAPSPNGAAPGAVTPPPPSPMTGLQKYDAAVARQRGTRPGPAPQDEISSLRGMWQQLLNNPGKQAEANALWKTLTPAQRQALSPEAPDSVGRVVKNGVVSTPNPTHLNQKSLYEFAQNNGMKPETLMKWTNSFIESGMQPTMQNFKFYIAQLRQKGLIKPEDF